MRRFTRLLLGVALIAGTTITSTRAGASSAAHSPVFVGAYRVTVNPDDPTLETEHTTWHVHADGTISDHHHVAHWSNRGKVFTVTATAGDHISMVVGTLTSRGIGRPDEPGTTYGDGVASGTWWARRLTTDESGGQIGQR